MLNDPDKEPEKAPEKPKEWSNAKPKQYPALNNLQYDFLDGLRGYGALTVYLQHFIYEMYPYFLYGRPEPGTKAEEDFHEPPVWLQYS